MVHYKLTYFPIRGLAESIRYILSYGKADFEDNRIDVTSGDTWNTLKPKTPMGQLPVLEIDGKNEIAQSRAISRYLAKQFGIAGQNDIEQALADMYVDGLFDMFTKGGQEFFGEMRKKLVDKADNDALITEKYQLWKTDGIAPLLDLYEKVLSKNGSGFLVGSKVTWADIVTAEFLDRLVNSAAPMGDSHLLDNHPKMATLVKTVHKLPGIAEYVEKRPVTPF